MSGAATWVAGKRFRPTSANLSAVFRPVRPRLFSTASACAAEQTASTNSPAAVASWVVKFRSLRPTTTIVGGPAVMPSPRTTNCQLSRPSCAAVMMNSPAGITSMVWGVGASSYMLNADRLPGQSLRLDVRAHLGHHALVVGLEVDVFLERLLDRHARIPVDLETIALRIPEVHAHRVPVGNRLADLRPLGAQPPRELTDFGDAAGVEGQLLEHLAITATAGPQQHHVVLLLRLGAQEVEALLGALIGDLEAQHPGVEV